MNQFLRNFIVGIVVVATSITISAQTHYSSRVSLGAKGGMGLSRIFFNPTVKQDMHIGGVFGFTVRYVEESHFGIIAELNWEQRGWKENFEGTPYNYSRTINYLQIPILTHIYFGRKAQFFFNAGPEIGIMVGESTSSNFNINQTNNLPGFPTNKLNTEEMSMPVNHKIDFGISAGMGGELYINPRNSIYLEGRFYYGLGNVLKSGRTYPFAASNAMSIMACVGYWFRIK